MKQGVPNALPFVALPNPGGADATVRNWLTSPGFLHSSAQPREPSRLSFVSSAPISNGFQETSPIKSYAPRPSTAPSFRRDMLEADLPPKRELPFKPARATKNGKPSTTGTALAVEVGVKANGTADAECSKDPGGLMNINVANESKAVNHQASSKDNCVPTSARILTAAADIDTQKLLAKASTRRSEAAKSPQTAKVKIQQSSSLQGTKTKRLSRCFSCRARRCKCERNSDDPAGPCRPCLKARKDCSFKSVSKEEKTFDFAGMEEKPMAQVQGSEEGERLQSQARRFSLRSRDVAVPGDDAVRQTPDTHPAINLKGVVAANKTEEKKRPTDSSMPLPPLKCQKNSRNEDHSSRIKNATQDKLIRRTAKFQRSLWHTSNLPSHIPSDATTATADPADINFHNTTDKMVPQSPPRPLFSEISEPDDIDNAENQLPQAESNDLSHEPDIPVSTPNSTHEVVDGVKAALQIARSDEKFKGFLVSNIKSDDFLELCKLFEHRTEQFLFKW